MNTVEATVEGHGFQPCR